MINLYIFLTITAIELVVIVLKIRQIKEHIRIAKEIGIQTRFAKHTNKTERFLIRMYENYKGMLLVLAILILSTNAIVTAVIHIIIVSYHHIIILNQ
jgi:hypothetical protein